MDTIGQKVKAFREQLGIKQEAFADALGISKQYVSNIETGQRGVSIEVLTSLANLGMDVNYLLLGCSEAEDLSDLDQPTLWSPQKGSDYTMIPLIPRIITPDHLAFVLHPKKPERKSLWRGIVEYGWVQGRYVQARREESQSLQAYSNFFGSLKTVPAPKNLTEDQCLLAMEVQVDTFNHKDLYNGDTAFFLPEGLQGDGIYALYIDGQATLKRLEIDLFTKSLSIMNGGSDQVEYKTSLNDPRITILGKIRGWMRFKRMS